MPVFGDKKADDYNDKEKKNIWILTPVNSKENTYFLRNQRYGEFLYAFDINKIASAIYDRRSVYTNRFLDNVFLDESYMWEFRKQNDGTFEIWNVKFNERT